MLSHHTFHSPDSPNNNKRVFYDYYFFSQIQVRLTEVCLLKGSAVKYIERTRVTIKSLHNLVITVPLCGGNIWILKTEGSMCNHNMWLSEWWNIQLEHRGDQQDDCTCTSCILKIELNGLCLYFSVLNSFLIPGRRAVKNTQFGIKKAGIESSATY